jgi:hypothetical protein
MATTTIKRLPTAQTDSDVAAIGAALNRLVDRVTALVQKMDTDFADVTNASVDYESVINGAGDNGFIKVEGLDADPYDPAPLT